MFKSIRLKKAYKKIERMYSHAPFATPDFRVIENTYWILIKKGDKPKEAVNKILKKYVQLSAMQLRALTYK